MGGMTIGIVFTIRLGFGPPPRLKINKSPTGCGVGASRRVEVGCWQLHQGPEVRLMLLIKRMLFVAGRHLGESEE